MDLARIADAAAFLHTATLLADGSVLVAGGNDLNTKAYLTSVEIFSVGGGK